MGDITIFGLSFGKHIGLPPGGNPMDHWKDSLWQTFSRGRHSCVECSSGAMYVTINGKTSRSDWAYYRLYNTSWLRKTKIKNE